MGGRGGRGGKGNGWGEKTEEEGEGVTTKKFKQGAQTVRRERREVVDGEN